MLLFPRLLARSLPSLFLCGVMLATHAHAEPFHFAVLMHVLQETGDENELKIALESAQATNPTFASSVDGVVSRSNFSVEHNTDQVACPAQQDSTAGGHLRVPQTRGITSHPWPACWRSG